MKFLNVTSVTFVTWKTYKLVQSWLVSIFCSSVKSLHFNQIQLCQQSFPNLRYPFNFSLPHQFIIYSQVQVLPSVLKVFPSFMTVSLSLSCLSPFNSYNRYCLCYSFWIIHYMRYPHLINALHYKICMKVVHLEFRMFSQFYSSSRLHLKRKIKSRKCFCNIYK